MKTTPNTRKAASMRSFLFCLLSFLLFQLFPLFANSFSSSLSSYFVLVLFLYPEMTGVEFRVHYPTALRVLVFNAWYNDVKTSV